MLSYQNLYNGFLEILDNPNLFSEDLTFVAQRWTNVFQNFYMQQIAPIPGIANPNLYPSLLLFSTGLIGAMKTQTVKEQFEILIQTLHLGVCTGVTMTGVYTTTPPPSPLKLQQCFNPNFSTKVIANMLASTIFLWIQPTFSIQTSSGVVIKWM